MIRVALNGGLGNQLFQYAAGRALAVRNFTDLQFDVLPLYSKLQWKNIATYRQFELDVFSIHAGKNDLFFRHKYLYPLSKAQYFLSRELNRMRYNYFKENDFSYDGSLLLQPDNTYLDGHFQSENYFKESEMIIRKELQFKEPLSGKNAEWGSKIENSNSVSIHIRRGDYMLLPKNLRKHGLTPPEYYQQAIQYIAARISAPHFYVFTDDVVWVKNNFTTPFPSDIIDNNNSPDTAYIDMQLMSLCRHQIICNSTFSWWAAWLNRSPEKIVVAPQQWFADPAINSKDIYPSEWIKL